MDIDLSTIPILVIDDDPTARTFLCQILKRLSFETLIEAADGEEALQCLEGFLPAVVFCDLHMKPMDGLSFLLKLRKGEDMRLRGLPVVMLTSEMRDEAINVAKTLKASDYIVKPTSRVEVKAALERALGVELPAV